MKRSTTLSAVLAGGLLAGLLLSGCGASQTTQTANQVPPIDGVNASTADGQIYVRQVHVVPAKEYPAGGNAPLVVRVFNTSRQAATLTAVTASDGGTVVLVSKTPPTPSATPSSAAPSSASASPSGSRRPSGSASASASASERPSATPTTPPALGSPTISVPIEPDSYIVLAPQVAERYLAIDKLPAKIGPGGAVTVTFVFTYADGTTTRLDNLRVPVGTPLSAGPRATASIHEKEGGGH